MSRPLSWMLSFVATLLPVAAMALQREIEDGGELVPLPDGKPMTIGLGDLPQDLRLPLVNRLGIVLSRDWMQGLTDATPVNLYSSEGQPHQVDLAELELSKPGSRRIRVLRSVNGMRIILPLNSDGEDAPDAKAVLETVKSLFRTDGPQPINLKKIERVWPEELMDGAQFSTSTNPKSKILLVMRWSDRLDFRVESGQLHVLFYMLNSQKAQPFDGREWFPESVEQLFPVKD